MIVAIESNPNFFDFLFVKLSLIQISTRLFSIR